MQLIRLSENIILFWIAKLQRSNWLAFLPNDCRNLYIRKSSDISAFPWDLFITGILSFS